MKRKAHARKATTSKSKKTTVRAKAKTKRSPKKTLRTSSRRPSELDLPLETPQQPIRERDIDGLTEQPKMRLSRKNATTFRENQRSRSQPSHAVNPSSRRH